MGVKFSHYRSYDRHRGNNVIQATMAWVDGSFLSGTEGRPVWVGAIVRRHPNDQPNKRVARTYALSRLNSMIVDYVTTPELRQVLLEDGSFFDKTDLSIVTSNRHILQALHKLCLAIPENVSDNFDLIQRLYEEDRLDIIDSLAAEDFHKYNQWVLDVY